MAITANVKGTKAVLKKLKKISAFKLSRVKDAIGVVQTLVVNDAKIIVPWVTGNLRSSISQGRVKVTPNEISGDVVAGMEYAGAVELGTSRQRAKPYLGPSLLKNQHNLNSFVKRALS